MTAATMPRIPRPHVWRARLAGRLLALADTIATAASRLGDAALGPRAWGWAALLGASALYATNRQVIRLTRRIMPR